ncbi:DegV family protein [Clostridium cellulovorans]|uniref:DegV family protein n=1 Tax=Clostridium cellulovorans (strain ATCC 35296 / DSM 3052 / OCM 3 / 743B) TaxID=573061 RepID=D9SPS2_CLOC7|nr:DegV family protein [Clostridium cellulovorans]ADL50121.1 degV family protein [Clostridium cellulovorans 743B]
MEKIAIITDSTCDLPKAEIDKYNIKVARLKVKYSDREYTDGIDITPEEIYARLDKEIPTTSTPTLGEIDNLFKEVIAENYTHAIVIPISSGLSGTMNNFRLVADGYDEIETFVFDSRALSRAVGFLLTKVGDMIAEGKSFKEITSEIPKLRENMELYFTVDSLEHLIKGGRIGRISGSLGQLLNLKPIVSMDEEGKYYTVDKVRGSKQAFNKLVNFGLEQLNNHKCRIMVMHANVPESAQKLYDAFKDHPNLTSIELGTLSAVAGVHSGPTLFAFVYMRE